ncbi:leishmanolysin domain-containing protein [Ditylenchus destructor]|nr:leishmanolysin domain-containing protein [Ditylenchus destructor]
MITVRNSPNDPQVSDDQILECANAHSLDDQSKSQPEYVTVEDFQPIPLSFTKSMRADSEVNLHKFGNFFIILQTNQKICAEDAHLLAAAAPCFDSRSNHRPLLGRMVICTNNSLWSQFTSSYDLFRHEILHTLGFGMIIPDRPTSVKSKTYDWMLGSGQSIPFEAHFMDFAEFAQEYFKCAEVDGIEAEDANKIHLNEYIFGNELMTPVVNEGKNYFTKFSASILEETYRGDEPWYLCNKELVEVETQQYWWGRAAGCDFLRKSCFELIHEPSINTAAEYPKMSEVRAQIDYESPELDEEYEDIQTIYPWIEDDKADTLLMHSEQMTIPLPFCDERDLFFEVALHAPKKAVIEGQLKNAPWNAKLVHCEHDHLD